MSSRTGIASQFGVVAETTYGTAVTVTRFYPIISESIGNQIARLESAAHLAGRRVRDSEQWAPGAKNISGAVQMEVFQQDSALLFEHMLGAVASASSGGIATHTVTPGNLDSKSLTVQVGRPDVGGTTRAYTYTGVKISEWELAIQVGELATLGLTLMAQDETTGISLASASYNTDAAKAYRFVDATVTLAGSPVDVRGLTLSGNNNLSDDRHRLGQDTKAEPLEVDLRALTGTLSAEFANLDQVNRYLNGEELAIVCTLSASDTAQIEITTNARYDGANPTVDNRGIIVIEHPIVLVGDGSDADALTIAIKNTQTNP